MKKQIICFILSILFILATSLLFSSILAIIKYNWIIDQHLMFIFTNIFAILVFFIAGFIYAYGINKKAILNAMAFVVLYVIFIIFNASNIQNLIFPIIKAMAYLLGCSIHYLLKLK